MTAQAQGPLFDCQRCGRDEESCCGAALGTQSRLWQAKAKVCEEHWVAVRQQNAELREALQSIAGLISEEIGPAIAEAALARSQP